MMNYEHLARGDLAALVSTRSHRAPFVLVPRDADALRARWLQKRTTEHEEEQEKIGDDFFRRLFFPPHLFAFLFVFFKTRLVR